jgi:hypothetical protein
MEIKFLLAKYNDCYALLTSEEIQGGEGFMADTKGIYEVPEIDGFIGFLKVLACTIRKGNTPLIKEDQIKIPVSKDLEDCWIAIPELDETGLIRVENGFINLIGIEVIK